MENATTLPIGEALQALLEERSMSNTDLWTAAGVSPATVSRYLSGIRGTPAIDDRGARTIEKLAEVFGLKPDYFLEYRVWRVREIARRNPALVDRIYDVLVEAAALEVLLDEGPDDA